jgi:uncharacterized membrane protein
VILGLTQLSNVYRFVLFLHILAAIVGFGSTFVWPMVAAKARGKAPQEAYAMNHAAQEISQILSSPFIYAVGVLGLILVLMDVGWEFSQQWLSAAMGLYIIAIALFLGLHRPNLKAMDRLGERLATGAVAPGPAGPPPEVTELQERAKRAGMYGGILHLLFLLILLDMVFKPGYP